MNLNWNNEFDESQIIQIHSLMKCEWWCSERSLSEVSKVVEGSDVLFGAINDKGLVVGFCRVLTDYIFKALIFDVIIESSYRNTGLGREIITKVLADEKLNQVKSFELYCPDRISGFYKKLGFSEYDSKLLGYTPQH